MLVLDLCNEVAPASECEDSTIVSERLKDIYFDYMLFHQKFNPNITAANSLEFNDIETNTRSKLSESL